MEKYFVGPEVFQAVSIFLLWGSSSHIPLNNLHAVLLFHLFLCHRMFFGVRKTENHELLGICPGPHWQWGSLRCSPGPGSHNPSLFSQVGICDCLPKNCHILPEKPVSGFTDFGEACTEIGGFLRKWSCAVKVGIRQFCAWSDELQIPWSQLHSLQVAKYKAKYCII